MEVGGREREEEIRKEAERGGGKGSTRLLFELIRELEPGDRGDDLGDLGEGVSSGLHFMSTSPVAHTRM